MAENDIQKEITANYEKLAEKILKENPGICPELVTIRSYAVLIKDAVDRLEDKYGHLIPKKGEEP